MSLPPFFDLRGVIQLLKKVFSVPGYAGTVAVTYPTINGVQYERYTGSGWNIAFTQNGQYVVPELYGNNFVIEDGIWMAVVL